MAQKKISADALGSALAADRIPASRSPYDGSSEGYLTPAQIYAYIAALDPKIKQWASGATVSHTGDTSEFALATIAVGSSLVNANSVIEVSALWSGTSSANNKSIRVRLGGLSGTQHMSQNLTTNGLAQTLTIIRMANAMNAQKSFNISGTSPFATVNAANVSGSIDMTAAQDLMITGQLANSSETISLLAYHVKLFNP